MPENKTPARGCPLRPVIEQVVFHDGKETTTTRTTDFDRCVRAQCAWWSPDGGCAIAIIAKGLKK